MAKFDMGDLGDLAKNAVQGLQKAGKLDGGMGELAQSALEKVKEAVPDNAPEQVVALLRNLLPQAEKRMASSGDDNNALKICVHKAQELLKSNNIPTEAVTKLTAELGTLLKGAPQSATQEKDGAMGRNAGTSGTAATQTNHPVSATTSVKATATPAKTTTAPTKASVAPVKTAAPSAGRAAGNPVAAAQKPDTVKEFSDVDAGAYYYDAVQWAVQEGIASGTTETTFSPDTACTCAQVITFLWRAAGTPAPQKRDNPFQDVKNGAYYYDAALWAAEKGIVTGKVFSPDEPVTRAQMAMFLYRNAGSPTVSSGKTFADVESNADYAKAVAWVAGKGITSGTGEDTFSPNGICTRGQIVTFLYRAK